MNSKSNIIMNNQLARASQTYCLRERAKYSSLSLTANCIAAKRYLRHYFKLICESPANGGHKFPLSITLLSFKTRNEWPPGWSHRKFSERINSTPAIFQATSKLFGLQDCSDDKNWLDLSSIFLRFVDFAVQFCFRCKFSFHE